MKYQANKDYESNDVVMTPEPLAKKIIKHYKPKGRILEPCQGTGNFYNNFPKSEELYWCEIKEGKDYYNFNKRVDWIITNPPYSKFTKFLEHSLRLCNNLVFLITVNHLWTKKRQRLIREYGFGIKEILLIDTPESFPNSGFQFGIIYLKKEYKGLVKIKQFEKEECEEVE